jgi:hypothetical protein
MKHVLGIKWSRSRRRGKVHGEAMITATERGGQPSKRRTKDPVSHSPTLLGFLTHWQALVKHTDRPLRRGASKGKVELMDV